MPFYKFWSAAAFHENSSGAYIMINLIYFFWVITTIGMQITMLNFLIAFISESYEFVLDTKQQSKYEQKAQLNVEYYQICEFYGYL